MSLSPVLRQDRLEHISRRFWELYDVGSNQKRLDGICYIGCVSALLGTFTSHGTKDSGERVVLHLRNWLRNGRCAFLLALGLLTLSAAVFGWGLQYKLSLYKGKDSISHQIPEAKLLSQKERPTADQAVSVRPAPMPVLLFPVLMVAAIASGLFQAAARYARTGSIERSRPPLPPCLHAILFRPPPALI